MDVYDFNDPCDDISGNIIGWVFYETHDFVRRTVDVRRLHKAVKYGDAYAGYPRRVLAGAMCVR